MFKKFIGTFKPLRPITNAVVLLVGISLSCTHPSSTDAPKTVDARDTSQDSIVKNSEIVVISNPRNTPNGTYLRKGMEDAPDSRLVVQQTGKDSINFLLYIINAGPAYNSGTASGTIVTNDSIGLFKTDEFSGPCTIQFHFGDSLIRLQQTIGHSFDCGFGRGVYANGLFTLKSAEIDLSVEGTF